MGAQQSREIEALGSPDLAMPAEARQKNEVGSELSARYYVLSLDSSPLRVLSRNCRACEALAGAIDAMKARGDTRVGGLIIVESISTSVIQKNAAEVALHFVQTPATTFLHGTPAQPVSSESETRVGRIGLTWDDAYQRWVVTELTSKQATA